MRYNRQELVLGKLPNKTVAIVGIGALGTVAAELLARSGVNLILIDRDIIELSNLQRQSLFTEEDIGKSKVSTAEAMLRKINSKIQIQAQPIHLSNQNVKIINVDLVLDCTDNLQTRFLINDYCKKNQIPWIYTAAIRNIGYIMPILPNGPCLACFLQEASLETCATAGVVNTITHLMASLEVDLAWKILLNQEVEPILYHFNISNLKQKKLRVPKNPNCRTCQGDYIHLISTNEPKIIKFCGDNKFQITTKPHDFDQLRSKLRKIGTIHETKQSIEISKIIVFKDGHSLVTAESKEQALTLYSKYIGN